MNTRLYREVDLPQILSLFKNAVHKINSRDYSSTQVNAWAPEKLDADKWRKKFEQSICFVAVSDEKIVGFANFETNGHIDCLYVDVAWRGPRVPLLLYRTIEAKARELKIKRLFSEVSITARRAAEFVGFRVEREQEVKIGDVSFINYAMVKELE